MPAWLTSWWLLPTALLGIVAALLLLIALWQGRACRRHWHGQRRVRASLRLLLLVCLALALLAAASAWSLRGYHRLASETPVLGIQAQRLGPQRWQLILHQPGHAPRRVQLAGDAWRVEAVVLKWQLPGVLAGLPPVYRLDRLSGRYRLAAQAAQQAPSVQTFPSAGKHDLFMLALAHHDWLPMVDTVYGSGAWMPLTDGARYEVTLMASGALVARRQP